MNEREQRIYKALCDPDTKERVIERLWPHASVVDNSWTRNVAWVKKGKKFLDTRLDLGCVGELSVIVGFRGFYSQNYEVLSTFTSEQVWNICKDLFQTKADKYEDFVADAVDAIHMLHANAVPDTYGAEKKMLDKSKKAAVNVLAKLACIARNHLDEWEE